MEKSAERIAFEEWADDGFALTLLWDDEAGEYCNPTIQAEWNAWNTAWYLSAIHQAKQPEATEQASQPQWIPVGELQPPRNTGAIVFHEGEAKTAYIDQRGIATSDNYAEESGSSPTYPDFTHWMPLPDDPKSA